MLGDYHKILEALQKLHAEVPVPQARLGVELSISVIEELMAAEIEEFESHVNDGIGEEWNDKCGHN